MTPSQTFYAERYDKYISRGERSALAHSFAMIDLANFERAFPPDQVVAPVQDSEPDYTHLLPDGWEFCEEAECVGFLKVRWIPDFSEYQAKIGDTSMNLHDEHKPYYRPIRRITTDKA